MLDLVTFGLESKLHATLCVSMATGSSQDVSTAEQDADARRARHYHARVDAVRSFLDVLTAVPSDRMHLISFVEWTSLPRIIMEGVMLSVPNTSHPPGWDLREVQQALRLDLVLDALCYRMSNTSGTIAKAQAGSDYWAVMNSITRSVNTWYRKESMQVVARRHLEPALTSSGSSAVLGTTLDLRDNSTASLSEPGGVPWNVINHGETNPLNPMLNSVQSWDSLGDIPLELFQDPHDLGSWGLAGHFGAGMEMS